MKTVCKRLALLLLPILGSIALLPAGEGPAQGRKRVTILHTKDMEVLTAAEVRELGFTDYPDIPEAENAAWDYIEAMNRMKIPGSGDYHPACEKEWDKWQSYAGSPPLREFPDAAVFAPLLADNAEAMAAIARATAKERGAFPVHAGAKNFIWGTLLPHLGGARSLARLVRLDALQHFSQGKQADAVRGLAQMFALSRHLRYDTFLIGGLVRVAIVSITHRTALQMAQDPRCEEATLRAIEACLREAEAALPRSDESLKSERLCNLFMVRYMVSPKGIGDMGEFGLPFKGDPDPDWAATQSRAARLLLPDRLVIADFEAWWERMLARVDKPFPEYRKAAAEQGNDLGTRDWNLLASLLLPALGRAHEAFVICQSENRLVRSACLLLLHQRQKKAWPQAIGEIPELAKPEFQDPLTGKPFLYHLQPNGGRLLYSPGTDLVDNGGDGDLETGRKDGKDLVIRFE